MNSQRGEEVFARISRWFERLGGVVRLDPRGDNLIRSARDGELEAGAQSSRFVIEVQGFCNLIHELAHAVQAGGLAPDSGFDYGLIPLNLELAAHRAWLWDELVACSISANYYFEYPEIPATVEQYAADKPCFERALAWFAEQVEILPVFYGLEGNFPAFEAAVTTCVGQFPDELARAEAIAFESIGGVLSSANIPERWSLNVQAWWLEFCVWRKSHPEFGAPS